ncbi:MAG: hypothetical protein ACKOTB_18430 [Planctomycetia bacterium]
MAIRAGVALVVTVVSLAGSGGCTSVIGSAYLREAWLDAVEQAADKKDAAERERPAQGDDAIGPAGAQLSAETDGDAGSDVGTAGPEMDDTAPPWAPATIDEAIAEADERLSAAGGLAEPARAALAATLEATPRQDWPVVVEEFTTALVTAQSDAGRARRPGAAAATRVSVEQDERAQPAAATRPEDPAEPVAPLPPKEPVQQQVRELEQEPAAVPPSPLLAVDDSAEFAVRNACFASRVRGWGVVDRFDTTRFAAGQEVIVYFELDALSARSTPDGHMTRIDTTLALVGGDGTPIERWSFEPLEETCRSRRRDYFARYVITLPATLPAGDCRLEIGVRDAVADRSSQVFLPLEIVGR